MAGFKQRELAETIGKTAVAYHYKETGRYKFTDEEKDIIFKTIKKKIPTISKKELFE